MESLKLAELLFSHITTTPSFYEDKYPKRVLKDKAKVTRLAPSPTGFMHLGNLYGAFADERLAKQSDGVFYLRIEDTDDKRYVEGAVDVIINSLEYFGVNFTEGVKKDTQVGDYGDYYQSNRGEIYQCFAKELVKKGLAYPCFLKSEDLESIHNQQESNKENFGIYGKWAVSRNLTFEEIEAKIKAGDEYVIRLKSDGDLSLPKDKIKMISVEDGIRGKLTMPANDQDVVILKTNGIPTYHFAHAVDDHLMRTTHVVRGAEWLPSLPIHVELFDKLGFEMPVFCHTAQLMKLDEDGNKRKLSKRKDPELSLDYYRQLGYHPSAVREYLLTLLNSNFEEWRIANPDTPIEEFEFTTEKMSNSGALFDLDKLNNISKDVFLGQKSEDIYNFLLRWAIEFDNGFYKLISENPEYVTRIIDIGRSGDKPRKDFIYAKQISEFISYFFDERFRISSEIPSNIDSTEAVSILEEYLSTYNHNDNQSDWFDKVRLLCPKFGYAIKPKDFKKNPNDYKGHIGDISTLIRIAITGRSQSPDIWEIQQVLGFEKINARVNNLINIINLP